MNKLLSQFIVYMLQKEADVIQEQEQDEKGKSMDSFNIVLDQINLEERDSRFDKTESIMRASRLEKRSSLIPTKDKP